ncbi:serine/threonine-protein kinase [Herbidospora yilanensis]|uniref:serine/threonine-protein kinase n=1 Tax=Herbidospora yilanensis TaxID=354426 RepID=UPI000783EA68|nr:serine/threonine-protein kinase [Herbidospora yilanensis]
MIEPLGSGDPKQLGPFTLSGRIGEGGQGTVYLGTDPSGERAAVKLLHVKFTGDAMARSRFARELRAAERVASFCTARVIAADLEGDTPYIASEYIDGPSLREQIDRSGPMSGAELERLAVGTATALTAIHQAGIIHRDFKPDNVLLATDGPRVVDFGISRILDSTGTITSRAIGTPAYMAPEQVSGDDVGPFTDVFAWGATIAYAATGQAAFGAKSIAAVLNRILNHDIDLSPLPEPLRGVVAASVSKRPADRPTAGQILLRLLGHPETGDASTVVMTQGALVANPETGPFPVVKDVGGKDVEDETREFRVPAPPQKPPSPSKRAKWWLPASMAVAAAMVLGGVAVVVTLMVNSPDAAPKESPSPSRSGPYASVLEKAKRTGKLTIGVKGDLPGVGFGPGDETPTGFEVEVGRYLAKELGAKSVEVREVSAYNRVDALNNGTVDMVVATYAWETSRNDWVTLAGPYYQARNDVLVADDSNIRSAADLRGKRLCVRPGTNAAEILKWLSGQGIAMNEVKAGDAGVCMDMLRRGEVDAFPGDDLMLAGFADRESVKYRVLGLGVGSARYSVGVPKGDVETCEAVRTAIVKLFDSGTARGLLDKFFGNAVFTPDRRIPVKVPCR